MHEYSAYNCYTFAKIPAFIVNSNTLYAFLYAIHVFWIYVKRVITIVTVVYLACLYPN